METVYREQTADRQLEKNKKLMTIGLAALCTAFVAILGKAWLDGSFDSVETFQKYVAGFGLAAPLFLIAVQAAQVVLPVLPGLLGCVAGSMMFGCWGGFWCNYIGISAGSIIAFLLARKYGSGLVSRMFPGEKYEKWAAWAAGSRFYTAVLFLGMVLPLFPDDYFCYFTGITKMSTRKFVTIILLGKPWCILAYCIMTTAAVA
ncbi:TVP38/TMEM64 family protein [Acetatifactor aquisgranensis]|uniref:TVP38/TMEM64 family protein n=1 Tax=Acetatifactor aquisgranensis TaxID=2941233 RepID=UPI00203C23B4|nr:TVP38/TMEM64 family protein [Acetatifactor aquisgranensis]MCI8543835.1 TVP38/TMEM64 family protein [Lachnospiraceae bacterium]